MTRKDYVLIAATFKATIESIRAANTDAYVAETAVSGVKYAANQLAINLSVENPRFDRQRFLTAAGVTE